MKASKCPICHKLESSSEIKACLDAQWWARSQTRLLENQINTVQRFVHQACLAEEQAFFDDLDKLSASEDYDYL